MSTARGLLLKSLKTTIVGGLLALSIGSASSMAGGDVYEAEKKKTLKIGAGALVKPKYEGSDEYEVIGFPYFSLGGLNSRVSVDGIDSIKYALHKDGSFEFGPLVGYRFGRDEDDGSLLAGTGDIDGGFVAGAYTKYWLGSSIYLSASYHHQLSGDDTGYEVKLKAGAEQDLSDRVKVKASVGATYSSEEYMDTFFSSGGYNADAGFKSVYASLGMTIVLSDKWEARVQGTYTKLLDEAADSPLVESEDQFTGLVGLAYSFDWPLSGK